MNEFLGGADGGRSFGSPHFSDVFITREQQRIYHDALLSPTGHDQVQRLDLDVSDFDLVLVSPLRRALQTYALGVHTEETAESGVPILAVPEASERLYLVSDLGSPVRRLSQDYPFVDFETYFADKDKNHWWYHPGDAGEEEWRPNKQGQSYGCPGEPDHKFQSRMEKLCEILQQRRESRILLVCHHGVIDHLLGGVDFGNCEYRTVTMDHLLSRLS